MELVGLCSYLLIGFWYTRTTAAAAAKKAFIVNRIGDFGFMIGLMLIFAVFGTLSFAGVFERAGEELTGDGHGDRPAPADWGRGQVAPTPGYVWLPDAMEGPTPVSALIHAATMVTAGVYVIAQSAHISSSRSSPRRVQPWGAASIWGGLQPASATRHREGPRLLDHLPARLHVPRLRARAYVAGVFHLMTHAFFKALLFLGAGSVIHAMSDEQDMHRMGGLRRRMPVTATTMAVGALALAGIPPLAGSGRRTRSCGGLCPRRLVLRPLDHRAGHYLLTLSTSPGSGCSCSWVSRDEDAGAHPHESPRVMTLPLVALAILSVVGGLVPTPVPTRSRAFPGARFEGVQVQEAPTDWLTLAVLAGLSTLAALAGAGRAFSPTAASGALAPIRGFLRPPLGDLGAGLRG